MANTDGSPITRTAELFLDIFPYNEAKTNKERLDNITLNSWQEEFRFFNMVFSNFEETYDILSIYYYFLHFMIPYAASLNQKHYRCQSGRMSI